MSRNPKKQITLTEKELIKERRKAGFGGMEMMFYSLILGGLDSGFFTVENVREIAKKSGEYLNSVANISTKSKDFKEFKEAMLNDYGIRFWTWDEVYENN